MTILSIITKHPNNNPNNNINNPNTNQNIIQLRPEAYIQIAGALEYIFGE